jgi:SAM-dependent methyltransferase
VEAQPHRFSEGDWRVLKCRGCGMVYLSNPPAQATLHDEHAWEHTKLRERARRREGHRLYYFFSDGLKKLKHLLRGHRRTEVQRIRRLCPRGGSVLDIGCADGGTLRALTDSDWKLYGIEPSPALAAASHDVCAAHGGRVECATAVDGLPRFPAAHFDLVVMRSYLEHEAHAAAVLREVARVLKPGGHALIKVPNAASWNAHLRGARWPGVRHPDHVNYFTARHLKRLLSDCGFGRCRFGFIAGLPTSDSLWATASPA